MLRTDPLAAAELLAKATHHTHEGLEDVRRSVSALRGAEHLGPFPDVIRSLVRQSAAREWRSGSTSRARRAPRPARGVHALPSRAGGADQRAQARRPGAGARGSDVRAVRFGAPARRDRGPGARGAEGGFGLVGLRERAQLLGGTLTLSTEPGQGFALELVLPAA